MSRWCIEFPTKLAENSVSKIAISLVLKKKLKLILIENQTSVGVEDENEALNYQSIRSVSSQWVFEVAKINI